MELSKFLEGFEDQNNHSSCFVFNDHSNACRCRLGFGVDSPLIPNSGIVVYPSQNVTWFYAHCSRIEAFESHTPWLSVERHPL